MIENWQAILLEHSSEKTRATTERFFRTGKGEYAESDLFIGVTVPDVRKVSRKFCNAPLNAIEEMLASPFHEFRLSGFLALVERYKKSIDTTERDEIVDFYLEHCAQANNWDLVDLSAPYIFGEELYKGKRKNTLDSLIESDNLWSVRIAIVSTLAPVRKGMLEEAFEAAQKLLNHKHHLIQKATGWVLRECGKKDPDRLRFFLEKNIAQISAITLSYSIEKFDKEERTRWRDLRKANANRKYE